MHHIISSILLVSTSLISGHFTASNSFSGIIESSQNLLLLQIKIRMLMFSIYSAAA